MTEQHVDSVVISVAYDGPPQAGKTTSVRSLARSYGREVFTPEEREGRTVYFDWLEYVGGRFEGAPIRCQIVAVPGQKRWTRRRGHFLDRADVVVFVGDTTRGAWGETAARLAELRARLDARDELPVGLVFQANKRDCRDAVPFDELRTAAANARTAIIESIASDGTGVREAFVFAVRLALDRVREEYARGRAVSQRDGFGEHGPQLVERLRAFDNELVPELPAIPPMPRGTAPGPRPPSHDAPSGFVWPPIEGRILLREAARSEHARVHVSATGDWVAHDDEWHVQSPAALQFTDLDRARTRLIAWARQHTAAQGVVSRRRCIVLAEVGDGTWRLWQIVERTPVLRELADRVDARSAARMVAEVSSTCSRADLSLTCSLDTIGMTELRQPIYVGLMPAPHVGDRG